MFDVTYRVPGDAALTVPLALRSRAAPSPLRPAARPLLVTPATFFLPCPYALGS